MYKTMPVEKMNREVPPLAKILPTFSHFNRNSHLDFVHNEINIIKNVHLVHSNKYSKNI